MSLSYRVFYGYCQGCTFASHVIGRLYIYIRTYLSTPFVRAENTQRVRSESIIHGAGTFAWSWGLFYVFVHFYGYLMIIFIYSYLWGWVPQWHLRDVCWCLCNDVYKSDTRVNFRALASNSARLVEIHKFKLQMVLFPFDSTYSTCNRTMQRDEHLA